MGRRIFKHLCKLGRILVETFLADNSFVISVTIFKIGLKQDAC